MTGPLRIRRGSGRRGPRDCGHPASPETSTGRSRPPREDAVMEDDALLRAAADRLEALAARTTPGDWRTGGLLATRPEVVAQLPDGSSEHVAEARAATGTWIATFSPALAAPLASWLRAAATHEHVDPAAEAFARAL